MHNAEVTLATTMATLAEIPSKLKTRSGAIRDIWDALYEFRDTPWVSYADPADATVADLIIMLNFMDYRELRPGAYYERRWQCTRFQRFEAEMKEYGFELFPSELKHLVNLHSRMLRLVQMSRDDARGVIRFASAEFENRWSRALMCRPSFAPLMQHAMAITTFHCDYDALVREIAEAARYTLAKLQRKKRE